MEKVMEKTLTNPAEKPPAGKQIAKQLIGLALAAACLFIAFKDCNREKLLHYAQQLDPVFLAAICAVALLSHAFRSIRWVILLTPLSDKKISLWNSFCAVMYGYAVNLAVPRGGEVARLVAISKTENIPWAGVLPTMFIDRLLDIAMLVMFLGVTITLPPLQELNLPWLMPAGLTLCAATVAGLVALPFVGKIIRALTAVPVVKAKVPEHIMTKINGLSEQFDLGTRALTNVVNLPSIAFLSVSIWGLYWASLYLMGCAFHLQDKLDVPKSLIVFTIGSVGVLVPTPGSVGSYHLLTSQALQKLTLVDADLALALATVLHFICFVAVPCITAAVCFAIQSMRRVR